MYFKNITFFVVYIEFRQRGVTHCFFLVYLVHKIDACQQKLKSNLKNRSQRIFEGIAKQGNPSLLNKIYTELYITEGGIGEVNNEHEVRQIETAS